MHDKLYDDATMYPYTDNTNRREQMARLAALAAWSVFQD
jgi:hypothetical protein